MNRFFSSTQLVRAGLTAGIAVGLALASSPAHAQAKGSGSERSRADEAAEEEAKKAREEREARVPTVVEEAVREKVETTNEPQLEYEDFRRQVEFKVAEKRKELVAYLDEILKQNPPEAERPELLFQKAELFLEEGQFHFFQANEVDDAIANAMSAGDDNKVLALGEKKDKSTALSKKWGGDAIKLFEEIEKKYPKFERMADVLYAMGQAYWDRGDYKQALKVYRKLIKDHPKSQFIPDAWLAFGEFYFQVADDEDRDLDKAANAYGEAAKFQNSAIFGYAIYKQGWVFYNQSRHDKAAERFKEVVLYSQVNESLLGTRKVGLAREARKDFVLAYAQFGSAAQAPAEFRQIADGEEHRAMLDRLGDIYYGDGKDRDAIITYQTLMKMTPESTRNPLYQGKIVKLASRIGEKRNVVKQARILVDEYKRVRAVNANLKPGDPKKEIVINDLDQADQVSDNTLRFLATTWHNEAKKTLDNSTFEYSYELYGDYLDLFPDRKEAYEMRFFFAELLFRLERFEQAGEQYVKVFTQDPKGKWAEASAEEAVRAYDEVVKDFDRAKKPEPPVAGADLLKEKPIPEIKQKYIAACNNYVQSFPKGKVIIEAKYKVARTLYDYNYFKDSTPRFMEVVENHAEHPRAEQAANLVLDTYNIKEDWIGLNTAARSFIANKPLMKNEAFRDIVLKVLEESGFKLISTYEKERKWDEAATRYLAFTDEFPKSTLADKALANAAAMFTRAGALDRAIKVRIRLVQQYKDSPLVADQIFAIASSYEQIVAYKDAANWLEQFVERFPKDDRARDALFNASIYRQGTGDTAKAVSDRELYLKTFLNAPDTEDVAYSIAVAWDEAGNKKKAVEAYNEFADKWRKKNPARALNAQYRAFQLLEQSKAPKKDIDRALKDLEVQSANYRKTGKSIDDVGDPLALVAFRKADVVLDKFKEIKIAKPDKPSEFKKTRDQKLAAKDAVVAAYTEVVKLKSPEWAVASLYRIGDAKADLAQTINAIPPPRGLTDEQNQMFRDKLGEFTLPLEEEAAQTMVLCLDKSAEFAVFNDWTRRCLGYLEENRANQYPKNQLEQRQPVVVAKPKNEQGRGLILELPKAGEPPVPVAGSEPPKPPAVKLKVEEVTAKKDNFDFEGEGG